MHIALKMRPLSHKTLYIMQLQSKHSPMHAHALKNLRPFGDERVSYDPWAAEIVLMKSKRADNFRTDYFPQIYL